MKCFKCNAEINNGSFFCTNCGVKQEALVNNNVVQNNNVLNSSNNFSPSVVPNNQFVNAPIDINANQKNLNNKKNKKKKKGCGCFVFFLLIIVIITIIVLMFTATSTKQEEIVNYEFEKDYKYFAINEDKSALISGASDDITFYVTSDAVVEVIDSEGNKVNVEIENNQVVNKQKYKKGETYTIKLHKGKFISEQLIDYNKVSFKIAREESKKHVFHDDVREVKISDINISEDCTSFKSNIHYEIGSVIMVDVSQSNKDAYVITSKNGNEYQIREAELNEIYKELDYYYEDYADLSNYQVAEQIKKYVVSQVKSSNWYNSLIQEVSAEPKINITLDKIENGIKAEVKVKVGAGDISQFLKSKNHNFEITFIQGLSVSQLVDVTLTNWDVKLDITSTQEFSFDVRNTVLKYSNTLKETSRKKEFLKKVKDTFENKNYSDSGTYSVPVAKIPISTPIPGLGVEIELKLKNELTAALDFKFKIKQQTNVVAGFDYGIGEKFKFVGSYDKTSDGIEISFAGKIEDKFGLELSAAIDFVNVVEAGVSLEAGFYASTEMKTAVTSDTIEEYSLTITAGYDFGIYIESAIYAEVGKLHFEHKFVDKEFSIKSGKKEYPFSTKEEQEESNAADNNQFLKDQGVTLPSITERLESYSCVDSMEEENYMKYKFIHEDKKLSSVQIVMAFNVDTGIPVLDEILKLLIRGFSIIEAIKRWMPASYYEEGTYVYIMFHLEPKQWHKEMEYYDHKGGNDYMSYKITLIENGFVCK